MRLGIIRALVLGGLGGSLLWADEVVTGLVLPYQEVSLSSAVDGLIEEVEVREGDTVKQGRILGRLADAEVRLEAERAGQVVALKQFDVAGTEKLLEREMVRRDEAMESRTELRIAELQSELAQVALERRLVRAPFDGVVVARLKEPGEWIETGEVFFELVSIDQVLIQVLLPHEKATSLQMGQVLPVTISGNGEKIEQDGKVDFIDPRVDAASGFQRVKILLNNTDHRILPGVRGTVRLQ